MQGAGVVLLVSLWWLEAQLCSRDAVQEGDTVLALHMDRFASHVLTTYPLLVLLLTLGLTATDITGECCISHLVSWLH
jgi:hypothetical protein